MLPDAKCRLERPSKREGVVLTCGIGEQSRRCFFQIVRNVSGVDAAPSAAVRIIRQSWMLNRSLAFACIFASSRMKRGLSLRASIAFAAASRPPRRPNFWAGLSRTFSGLPTKRQQAGAWWQHRVAVVPSNSWARQGEGPPSRLRPLFSNRIRSSSGRIHLQMSAQHKLSAAPGTLHGFFSRDLPPVLTIDSGDHVTFQTLDSG